MTAVAPVMIQRRRRVTAVTTKRLDFELPDFTREPAWVSQRAKDLWAPRIARITAAWTTIERESVGRIRQAGLVFTGAGELAALRQWCNARRLMLLPVSIEGETIGASYSASSTPAAEGQPWRMRAIVCDPALGAAVQAAYLENDELAIGALLGYPACCAAFYLRTWVDERWRDTTWPMALRTPGVQHVVERAEAIGAGDAHADPCLSLSRIREERLVIAGGAPLESNILLRWLGLRLVPHLPCSLACEPTAGSGRAYAALGRELGFVDEMGWLEELLAWPIEWSALHGIAEVKTPAFKFAARTDATAHKWTVQREGTRYPDDVGASGIVFPFREASRRMVTDSRSFAAAIALEAPMAGPASMDNGFATPAAEASAHTVVLRAAAALTARGGCVLDLGCGNGKLVSEICAGRGDRVACGVELNPDRARRAADRLGDENAACGSLVDAWPLEAPYGILIVMPGRLLELDAGARAQLVKRIVESGAQLVVYAYGDWLMKDAKGLVGLTAAAFGDQVKVGDVERADRSCEAAPAWPVFANDYRCTGACCEHFTLNGGAGLADMQAYLQRALERIEKGTARGFDFDAPILVPTLEITQAPTPADPKTYFRCGHHDRATNACTIYETRPRMCREYPTYATLGRCGGCGFAPEVST